MRTQSLDFGPDRSIVQWYTGRKCDTTIYIALVRKVEQNFTGCYSYVLFNNFDPFNEKSIRYKYEFQKSIK